MAILYELLAGGASATAAPSADAGAPAPTPIERARVSERIDRALDWRGARAAGGTWSSAARRVLDPRAGIDGTRDVVVRERRDRRAGRPGERRAADGRARWSRPRACTSSRPSSTRTCTCARPATRTRRTSRPARAPPRPAATARSSRWPNTEPPVDYGRGPRLASRARRARGLRPGGVPGLRHPGHGGRGADRDGRAARRRGRRLLRRRPADPKRPRAAARASVPAAGRRRDRAPRGGPRPLRRRRHARGRGLGRCSGWPGSRRSRSRR